MAEQKLMHCGSHGGAECGAHGDGRVPEDQLTKDPTLVTCPTCRGWLPLVHNWKPREAAREASTPIVVGEAARERIAKAQRYDLVTNYRCGSSIEEMEQADEGEWVRFEDIEAALRGEGRDA